VCRFWVPEDTVAERDSVRTPYKKWVADGALLTTPGNVTDYDFIEFKIIEDVALFGLTGMGFDPWNATQVVTHLQEEGLPLVEVRQGFASLNPGSKELERLFQSGQLEHGNHPVLQWMFGNATIRKDPAGNIKPDKERAAEKIDGVAAAATGLGVMLKPKRA
jgi:phage terminase large subunit-like protein